MMDSSRRSIYVGLPRTELIGNEKTLSVLPDKLVIYFQRKSVGNCDVDHVGFVATERSDTIWLEVTFSEPSGVEHVFSNAKHELNLGGYGVVPLEIIRADSDIPPRGSRSDDDKESFTFLPEDDVKKSKDGGLKTTFTPKAKRSSSADAPPSQHCGSRNAASLHLGTAVASPEAREVPPVPSFTNGAGLQKEFYDGGATDEDLYGPNMLETPLVNKKTQIFTKKSDLEALSSQHGANKDQYGSFNDHQKPLGSPQSQPSSSGDGRSRQPSEGSIPEQQQMVGATAQGHMDKQEHDPHGRHPTTKASGPRTSKKKRRKGKGKRPQSDISEEKQTDAPAAAPSIHQEHTQQEDLSVAQEEVEDEDDKEEEEEEQFLEVTGFKSLSASSVEMLKMHFENYKRSGGGDIKTWEHDPKTGVIRMTYEDPSVAAVVVGRPHRVDGDNLKVQLVMKKKRPVKKRCLFLNGIPDGSTSELVTMFMENRSGTDDFEIQYCESPGSALCTFTEDIKDVDNVIKSISSKSLSGGYLTAEKVHESDCILVEGVSPKVSLEMIELYFDNKKKSGGSGVRAVQHGKTDTQVIVYFEDWKVVRDVLSKRGAHKVGGNDLLVEEYHECLGRLSALDVPTPHVPKPVTVQVAEPIMEFIYGKGQRTQKTLIQKLRDANAILKWPDGNNKTTARLEPLLKEGQRQSWLKWSETASHLLTVFLAGCKSSRIAVPQQCWKAVADKINQRGNKSFAIQLDASKYIVTLVGEQQDVDKGHADIDGIVKELKAKAEYEAQQTKVDIRLTEEKLLPFFLCGIKDNIEKEFPNLNIPPIPSQDKNKLVFEGSRKIVQEAELSMRRQIDSLEKVELKSGPNKVKFVRSVIDKIHESLGAQHIRAACKGSDDGKIIISGVTVRDTSQARSYLCQEIVEDVIVIGGQATKDVLCNPNGQKLLDAINKRKFVMVAIKQGGNVELAGFKTYLDETKQHIIEFLNDNVILQKLVAANKNKICLITEFHGLDLMEVQRQNVKNHVKVKPQKNGRNKGFVIQGNEEGSNAAVQAITSLVDRIKEQPYPVSKTGMAQLFREDKGKKFLQSLETEFQCVIRENIQEDSDDEAEVEGGTVAMAAMASTTVLCQIALPGGFTLKVCRGDLTKQKVDGIVNAANTELNHIGGLADAIVKAGGRVIQTECDQIMKNKGRKLYVGEPVHSTSGKLPCKRVIHVAGPKWPHLRGASSAPDDEPSHEEHLLYQAVAACLRLADKMKLRSLAVPAISTGVYGFPVELAVEQILNSVADFCQTAHSPTLTEIHFTNNEQATCEVFKRAVMNRFKRFQEENGDGTDVDNGPRGASSGTPGVDDVPQYAPAPAPAPTPAPKFTSSGQNNLTTTEGITITLKKGTITSETVEVIVNTAGSDMQLGNGAVSKAILQAAGPALQQECTTLTATRGRIPAGEFLQTGPAALACKKIYHCVCESYDPARAEQFLKKLVLSLMEQAEQSEMLSIAIPALGTGNLQYPADVTAQVMYDSIAEFSRQHPSGVLKDVRFVVYDKDVKTIQAFEGHIQRLLNPPTPAGAAAFVPSSHGRKLKKSGASSGPIDRQAYSAIQHDDTGMLQTKIGSVCLQVGPGNLLKEATEAIVNSVGSGLDLRGPVSQAILAKGGKNIAQECDFHRKQDPRRLIYVTTAGRLQNNCIVHAVTPSTTEEIKTAVLKTLNEVEKVKVKSVSFPALGTGQATNLSVADCASAILAAVGTFAVRKKPRHLRLIRIVIFQKEMVSGFQDALRSTVGTSYKEQQSLFSKGLGIAKSVWSAVSGSGSAADASADDESLQETIILNIYAMDMASIKKACDKIDEFQGQEYTSEDRPDEYGMMDKMTTEHTAELKAIESNHKVKISCHNKGQAKFIRVQGCTLQVKDACIKIQELFTKMKMEELEMQQREHLYKEVQWKYSTATGQEVYDPEINVMIEEAYSKKCPWVTLSLEDGPVTIVFQTMQEKSAAGIVAVHRVDLKKVAAFETPSNWIPMGQNEHFKTVKLMAGSAEYTNVETLFQQAMAGHQIQEIHRIQNVDLLMLYQARQAAMQARLGRPDVEETLYHGTDEQTCLKINREGFNRSFCGKNATAYGNGTYFAVSADYSAKHQYAKPNANGVQHVYLTKVLVGDFIRGHHGIITPPNKPNNPDQLYDSVVDNANQPSIYVIFQDAQAYPEYLIKFQ